ARDFAAPALAADDLVEDGVQRLAKSLPTNELRQHLADAAQSPEAVLEQQILAAPEVQVEGPLRHPGGRADRVDGGGVDAALDEEPVGSVADRRARALAAERELAGTGSRGGRHTWRFSGEFLYFGHID